MEIASWRFCYGNGLFMSHSQTVDFIFSVVNLPIAPRQFGVRLSYISTIYMFAVYNSLSIYTYIHMCHIITVYLNMLYMVTQTQLFVYIHKFNLQWWKFSNTRRTATNLEKCFFFRHKLPVQVLHCPKTTLYITKSKTRISSSPNFYVTAKIPEYSSEKVINKPFYSLLLFPPYIDGATLKSDNNLLKCTYSIYVRIVYESHQSFSILHLVRTYLQLASQLPQKWEETQLLQLC